MLKAIKATASRNFPVAHVVDSHSIDSDLYEEVAAKSIDWITDRNAMMGTIVKEILVKVCLNVLQVLESPRASEKII